MNKKLFFAILSFILISSYMVFHFSNIKSTKIEKIYVINLDRSVERYRVSQEMLKTVELPAPYTRFSAVDGKKIQIRNIDTGEVITGEQIARDQLFLDGNYVINCDSDNEKDFIEFKAKEAKHRPRLIGEMGVACSHKKIWRMIVENNYENVLILEDDFHFERFFSSRFKRALNNSPKDAELLYFAYGDMGNAYIHPEENPILRYIYTFFDKRLKNPFWKRARRNIGSMQGYVISAGGAKKLLEAANEIYSEKFNCFLVVDVMISKALDRNKITAYVSKPSLILPDPEIKSDIGLH